MKDNFEIYKNLFTKTIKRLVEMKHITVNQLISDEGVASAFANDMVGFEVEEKKRVEINQMFEAMSKYFPNQFKNWGDLFKEVVAPSK